MEFNKLLDIINQLYEEESFQYAKFFHFLLNKKALTF